MLRYLIATCLGALLVLGIAHRTSAKPPDLPDNDPIIVTAPVGTPVATPELDRLVAQSNDVTPYAPASPQSPLPYGSTQPAEAKTTVPAEKPEKIRPMPCLETNSPCPYRACPPTDPRNIEAAASALPSVLDNLRTLEKARAAIEKARKLGKAGKMGQARKQLARARKLCPGSSMVRRADEVLQELTAVKTHEATEEQQESSCPEGGCGCCPLARINNCGMCWVARVCDFCEEVQKTACPCCRSQKAIPATISLDLKDTPLLVVVHDLNKMQVPVTLDLAALQGRGICPHLPITLRVEQIPPMAALDILTRPLGLEARPCGESICITLPAVSRCGPGVPTNGVEEACERTTGESACPRCEELHRRAVKMRKKNVAGIKEQVNGLMKACYLAIGEGRNAKAADLAREAHALDPKRVEGDPLIYKLHLLGEKGQNEECEKGTCTEPTGPQSQAPAQEQSTGSIQFGIGVSSDSGLTGSIVIEERNFDLFGGATFRGAGQEFRGADTSASLRPELPAVDPDVVVALDAVLTTPARPQSTVSGGEEQSEKDSCCPCCAIAKQVAFQALHLFFDLGHPDTEQGYLKIGLSTEGVVTVHSLSKCAGMKVLVLYRSGIPVLWVQPEDRVGD